MAARLPSLPPTSTPRPWQDQCYFQPELASCCDDNICVRLEDFMEGHSSNPVAKRLISMPCGLVKVFMCIYNYSFTFLPGHPQTWDWIALMGCSRVPGTILKLISMSTGAGFFPCSALLYQRMSYYQKVPSPLPKMVPWESNTSKFYCDKKHLSYDLLLFSTNYNLRAI